MMNPYRLQTAQQTRLARYFTNAAQHGNYEITAATLYHWLYVQHRRVVVVDTRQPLGPYSFAVGHIPGSHNIPIQFMARELRTTHAYRLIVHQIAFRFFPLPRHTPIVALCYDGNAGQMTAALLRVLGYQAYGLKLGISSWNRALNVWPQPGQPQLLLPITSGGGYSGPPQGPTGPYTLGNGFQPDVARYYQRLQGPYPSGFTRPWVVFQQTVNQDPTAFQIIDLRNPAQFAQGHIPGSINIPFAALGAHLSQLNPAKPIVLVSTFLQRASQSCAILRLLGYHAYILKMGLAGWNPLYPVTVTNVYPLATGVPHG